MEISSGFISNYYNLIYNLIASLTGHGTLTTVISLLVAFIIFAILIAILFTVFALAFGWFERKAIARMQSRRGPTYVGKWGMFQNVADLIKLMAKENIIPDKADKPLFVLILPVIVALFVLSLVFIPLTQNFVGINSTLSLLVVFIFLSFTPILIFLAGWTSGNKFGSISAQRSVVMLISYEIPLFIVIITAALLVHGFSFTSIVNAQSSYWFIEIMPIGFVVFFIVMLAEMERPPFDLREADSELISGWITDLSAPYYGLALFLDYLRMFVGSLLIVLLFLGGWLGPKMLPQFFWVLIKVVIVSVFIVVIRATMMRMRLDRVLKLGWNYLMPLSVLNLLITFIVFVK
jgi:NADH-quinone oxidoreductase subunit H